MRLVTAADIEAALGYPELVDILEAAFRIGAITPPRHHHAIAIAGRPEATLLLMPAWTGSAPGAVTAGAYAGVKLVTVFPDNARLGKPAVYGVYLLLSTESGEPLALMDAPRLTVWRTAAASAMAARRLARADASRMLLVGAGALGAYLVRAHLSVRPIREVAIWNRTSAHAEDLARRLGDLPARVMAVTDLEAAARQADVISTATLSPEPLIRGAWLKSGTHLDCVGAYRPTMRETDDDVVRRARLWVDTWAGGLTEAGDIVMPLTAGIVRESDIVGDLFDLARGRAQGRQTNDEITMFKSVGAAIEDLAAAIAVYERRR